MSDGVSVLSFPEAIKAIFAGLAAVAVWLLKKLGEKHLESIDGLGHKLDKLIERLDRLSERVTVVEVSMRHLEHERPNDKHRN